MYLWIVMRHHDNLPAEPLAAFTDRAAACDTATRLGEGHYAAPCLLAQDDDVRVEHRWGCAAKVTGGAATVHDPRRLPGAARLLLGDEPPEERVVLDRMATELEAHVLGRRVVFLTAYADSPERARELATAHAESHAERQRLRQDQS